MTFSLNSRVKVPEAVLISDLHDESVILNLDSERYYGLDDVGTRMYSVLTSSESIKAALDRLVNEYQVDRNVLESDVFALIENLLSQGLVEVVAQ